MLLSPTPVPSQMITHFYSLLLDWGFQLFIDNTVKNMNRGGLKQIEFQFTASIAAVTEVKQKQRSKFHLVWKIVHESQGKEILGSQYLEPDRNGVIPFSTELKTNVRIIFNKETNTYLKKKSMLCLNYFDDQNHKEPKLGGLVTLDLGDLASKASSEGFVQYSLERSPFKNSTITLKIVSKKLKQELMSSFSWESKELSFQSLFDRTKDTQNKRSFEKKEGSNRKSINRLINDQFSETKRTSTEICEDPLKQLVQRQVSQNLVRQLREQNQGLLNRVYYLERENSGLKQNSLPGGYGQRAKTLGEQLADVKGDDRQDYNHLLEQNRYVLQQLERVSLQLAKREQEMSVLKSEYDKLRRNQKKKEKAQEPKQMEQHIFYLSGEVMRLHEELANYRETEVENNQLKREKGVLESEINDLRRLEEERIQETGRFKMNTQLSEVGKTEEETFDIENRVSEECEEIRKGSFSRSVPSSLRESLRSGLTEITQRCNNQTTNSKIQDISNQLLKLKNISLNGMTMQNKKNFLTVVKKLENKVNEAATV